MKTSDTRAAKAAPADKAADAKTLAEAFPIPARLIRGTCMWFTVMFLLLTCVGAVTTGSFDMNYIHTVRYILLIPYALLLTLAGMARTSSLPGPARGVLHFVCAVGGFWLCVYLPYQLEVKPLPRNILIIMLLVSILWFIGFFIRLGVVRRRQRRAVEDQPYESQFKKS